MSPLRNSDFQDDSASDFCNGLVSDEQMLTELYRQMLKAARNRLYNKSEATDVVQEAWVRILERQSTLREADKLVPWARAIASNIASNRNRAKRTSLITDSDVDMLPSRDSIPQPELMAELSDILGHLDAVTRTLLLYKFYYGFKDDEIAAAFDVPVGTVKARIHRSKARLRREAKDDPANR